MIAKGLNLLVDYESSI